MQVIKKDKKQNYLKEDGTLLSNDWFDEVFKRFFNNYSFYGIYDNHIIYDLNKIVKTKLID